jgi:hypothetical protein
VRSARTVFSKAAKLVIVSCFAVALALATVTPESELPLLANAMGVARLVRATPRTKTLLAANVRVVWVSLFVIV